MKNKYKGSIGKPRELPVLIDVDGVCADFVGSVCNYIENRFGIEIDQEKIYTDVREQANGLWDERCEDFIKQSGFAYEMIDEIPGAVKAIQEIMEEHPVMFVTSPYSGSATWSHDRYMWLEERFDIGRDDVIFCRDKRFIHGSTLIDDRWENILDWSNWNNKCAVLFKQSWNQKELQEAGRLVTTFHGKNFTTTTSPPTRFHIVPCEYGGESTFFALNNWDVIKRIL